MSLTTVVAMVALGATWLLAFFVCLGLGLLLVGLIRVPFGLSLSGVPARAGIWLGFALAFSYVQWVHLFLPITWVVTASLIVLAVLGYLLFGREWWASKKKISFKYAFIFGALMTFFILYVANQALVPALSTDSYLYHFQMIRLAQEYPQIPGLAHLHIRFGNGLGLGPATALVGVGVWRDLGHHLLSPFLLIALAFDAIARWRVRGFFRPTLLVSGLLTLLFVGFIAVGPFYFRGFLVGESGSAYWLTSPNPDFLSLILIMVSGLYLLEFFVSRSVPQRRLASLVAVVVAIPAAFIRPLNLVWIALVFCAVLVYEGVGQDRARRLTSLRSALFLALVTLSLLIVPQLAHQSVVTGYVFFPAISRPIFFGDWAIPSEEVSSVRRVIQQWARDPNGDVNWFPIWLIRTSLDVWSQAALAASVITALSIGVLFVFASRYRYYFLRSRVILLTLIPVLVTGLVWFLVGPDLRFAYGYIWLVPVILISWLATALFNAERTVWPKIGLSAAMGALSLFVVTAEPEAINNLRLKSASGEAVLGLPRIEPLPVKRVTNSNGVAIYVPDSGENCGYAPTPCGLSLPEDLEFRGEGVREGFRIKGQ